jgi:hypothetical protein
MPGRGLSRHQDSFLELLQAPSLGHANAGSFLPRLSLAKRSHLTGSGSGVKTSPALLKGRGTPQAAEGLVTRKDPSSGLLSHMMLTQARARLWD